MTRILCASASKKFNAVLIVCFDTLITYLCKEVYKHKKLLCNVAFMARNMLVSDMNFKSTSPSLWIHHTIGSYIYSVLRDTKFQNGIEFRSILDRCDGIVICPAAVRINPNSRRPSQIHSKFQLHPQKNDSTAFQPGKRFRENAPTSARDNGKQKRVRAVRYQWAAS